MEVLSVLEQKISSLVAKLHNYIEVNEQLRLQKEVLQKEVGDLKAEILQLTDENMQLTTKVQSFLDTNNDLCQEKEDAKRFVDDLIRSIESLVEQENQL